MKFLKISTDITYFPAAHFRSLRAAMIMNDIISHLNDIIV